MAWKYSKPRQNSASFWITRKAVFTTYISRFTPGSLFNTYARLEESEADDARKAQTPQWGNSGPPHIDVHLSPPAFDSRPRPVASTTWSVLWAFQWRVELLDQNRRVLDRLHAPHPSKNTGAKVHIQANLPLHITLTRSCIESSRSSQTTDHRLVVVSGAA